MDLVLLGINCPICARGPPRLISNVCIQEVVRVFAKSNDFNDMDVWELSSFNRTF